MTKVEWRNLSLLFFIVIVTILFSLAVSDFFNPGEICVERNFGAEVRLREDGEIVWYCVRNPKNGTAEVRPVDWVRNHCGNNGVCIEEELVSREELNAIISFP